MSSIALAPTRPPPAAIAGTLRSARHDRASALTPDELTGVLSHEARPCAPTIRANQDGGGFDAGGRYFVACRCSVHSSVSELASRCCLLFIALLVAVMGQIRDRPGSQEYAADKCGARLEWPTRRTCCCTGSLMSTDDAGILTPWLIAKVATADRSPSANDWSDRAATIHSRAYPLPT